jgi:hypothetical protein
MGGLYVERPEAFYIIFAAATFDISFAERKGFI